MVTNVHIARISEKLLADDFTQEIYTFKNDTTDCSDSYNVQTNTSWTTLLTGQRTYPNSNERKYPIRVFAIQAEA